MKGQRRQKHPQQHPQGFTLIEALLSVVILGGVVFAFFATLQRSSELSRVALYRTFASDIAEQELEIASLIPYTDVGTVNGFPKGILADVKTVNRDGEDYTVTTVVEYVDDEYDGDVFGCCGKPVDTAPADYKVIEVKVCWTSFTCTAPVRATTTLAPPGLESDENTGVLLVQVFDGNGIPVPLADVTVENTELIPAFSYTTTTDIDGRLLLLNLEPAQESYHITVGKTGYTSDSTYPATDENPNPVKPDASVVVDDVTSVSFTIDRVSEITLSTINEVCAAVPDLTVHLTGQKLIGTDPDIPKVDQDIALGPSGTTTLQNLDPDTYTLTMASTSHDIGGTNIPQTFALLADSSMSIDITAIPHEDYTLLVSVKDAVTDLALSGASVRVEATGYDETKIAGEGTWQQLDWSGGSGQADFTDPAMYFSDDGNVEVSTPAQMTLKQGTSAKLFSEEFTTTTYEDAALTTAEWETAPGRIVLPADPGNPGAYLPAASIYTTKLNADNGIITAATLTPTAVLNGQEIDYFLSADGGMSWEAVAAGIRHEFAMTGNDLRFRADLRTANALITPELDRILIDFDLTTYATNAELVSSSFDTGSVSTPRSIVWEPVAQNPQTGTDPVRLQIATNDDNATWSFLGPDGTPDSFYTVPGEAVSAAHADTQYIRYRVLLQTADVTAAPLLTTFGLTYGEGCIPAGQAFFSPLLAAEDHTVTVSLEGYEEQTQVVPVSGNAYVEFSLVPN